MNFGIISELPLWLILVCILTGALLALLLYYRNSASGFSRRLSVFLGILRFLTFTLVSFLLLSLLVRTLQREVENPEIVIGIDNSASMTRDGDSAGIVSQVPELIRLIQKGLGNKFEIKYYLFGQEVRESETPDFSDSKTDVSSLLGFINSRYYNRNLGALVLMSDGIYNSGENPLYQVKQTAYPVYTVKFGDTTINRDIIISKVNHNRYAFKGNRFPIEVVVHARQVPGESSRVSVWGEDKELFSRDLTISSGNQVFTIPLFIDAGEPGLRKFRISVDAVEGEINTQNNTRNIFVEVREMKQKIAIVADSPHPDLAALKRAFESSNNYDAGLFYADNYTANTADYSLFILHQLPSSAAKSAELLADISRLKIPVLFILGEQTNLNALNKLQAGISLTGFNKSVNEALPVLNKDFPLFIISGQTGNLLSVLPPLVSPFANYQLSNASYVLAYQQIGQLKTELPLIAFSQTADSRYGFIAGEGIWKWRFQDYALNKNHDTFDDLMAKAVQYLSQPTDKGKFRVIWNNYYTGNDPVDFSAKLFNESDEPITGPEIKLLITNEQGQEYSYSFSSNDETYFLRVGSLPPGLYSFKAETNPGTGILTKTGNFVVTALNLEDVNSVADHRLLDAIAYESKGNSFMKDEVSKMIDEINAREDIKPIVFSKKRYTDLVDFYPLLILIVLMMGLEWFLRKYAGSY